MSDIWTKKLLIKLINMTFAAGFSTCLQVNSLFFCKEFFENTPKTSTGILTQLNNSLDY